MRKELLRLEAVRKAGVLRDFRMNILEGEVLALAGLTGSGMAVIADILDGACGVDSGFAWFDERRVPWEWFERARDNGIFTFRGKSSLVRSMTVADNIFVIQRRLRTGPVIRRDEITLETETVLRELDLDIGPNDVAGDLSPERQRMVELVKAVTLGARLIVLEDVWGSYTKWARDSLFELIRKLHGMGVTFLILTQRHEDMAELMDRMILMRDGQKVMVLDRGEYRRDFVYRTLIGHDFYLPTEPFGKGVMSPPPPKEALRVEGLSGRHLQSLSFSASSGEVFGLLDVQELYSKELVDIIIHGSPSTGSITLAGKLLRPGSRLEAMREGAGMVAYRDGSMLHDNLTWPENLAFMYRRRLHAKNPLITKRLIRMLTAEFEGEFEGLDPRAPLSDMDVSEYLKLKLTYLKWIMYKPRLLICAKPCASGDVLLREVAISMIRQAAARGICVLVVSSDPKEAGTCCDRIGVLAGGRLAYVVGRKEFMGLPPEKQSPYHI